MYQPNPNRKVFLLYAAYGNVCRCNMPVHAELWKVLPARKNDSDIWIPMELRRRHTRANQDPARIANLAHELAIADVYAAMFPHASDDGKRILSFWERSLQNETYTATRYDASLVLFDQPFFLEVERGNHPIVNGKVSNDYYQSSLNFKFERYIEYFKRTGKPFTVLVTVEDWKVRFLRCRGKRGTH